MLRLRQKAYARGQSPDSWLGGRSKAEALGYLEATAKSTATANTEILRCAQNDERGGQSYDDEAGSRNDGGGGNCDDDRESCPREFRLARRLRGRRGGLLFVGLR